MNNAPIGIFDSGIGGIQIDIIELPTLSEFKITGLKKSKIETIVSETELKKGKKILMKT